MFLRKAHGPEKKAIRHVDSLDQLRSILLCGDDDLAIQLGRGVGCGWNRAGNAMKLEKRAEPWSRTEQFAVEAQAECEAESPNTIQRGEYPTTCHFLTYGGLNRKITWAEPTEGIA
jgi:hypothetical protein